MGESRQGGRRQAGIARALLLAVVALGAGNAAAQGYPAKPVRIIAASSPGSGVDIVSRIVAQKLSDNIRQQVIVDNRAGAGGNIGAELAAKAPPDGYTLLMATPAHAISGSMYRRLNYDTLRDFAPVSQVTSGQYILVTHPSLPVKTLKEFTAFTRARPGQLNYGSGGPGNSTHLAVEFLRSLAKINVVHVPYKGSGPAITDLIGGQVQFMIANLTAGLPHVKSGRMRGIVVTGRARSPALPEIPTAVEAGLPEYIVINWFGLLAPAATPADIIARLNDEVGKAMRAPDMKDRLAGEGAEPAPGSAADFAAFLRAEAKIWGKVVKDAGVTVE